MNKETTVKYAIKTPSVEKAKEISYMILKELSRFDFTELCEGWGLTCEEVEEFLECGVKYFENKVLGVSDE